MNFTAFKLIHLTPCRLTQEIKSFGISSCPFCISRASATMLKCKVLNLHSCVTDGELVLDNVSFITNVSVEADLDLQSFQEWVSLD